MDNDFTTVSKSAQWTLSFIKTPHVILFLFFLVFFLAASPSLAPELEPPILASGALSVLLARPLARWSSAQPHGCSLAAAACWPVGAACPYLPTRAARSPEHLAWPLARWSCSSSLASFMLSHWRSSPEHPRCLWFAGPSATERDGNEEGCPRPLISEGRAHPASKENILSRGCYSMHPQSKHHKKLDGLIPPSQLTSEPNTWRCHGHSGGGSHVQVRQEKASVRSGSSGCKSCRDLQCLDWISLDSSTLPIVLEWILDFPKLDSIWISAFAFE